MKTPSTMDRDERSIITLTVKSTTILLIVNSDTRWARDVPAGLEESLARRPYAWLHAWLRSGHIVPLRHTLSLTHMKVLA
jgi:hypothetical protein